MFLVWIPMKSQLKTTLYCRSAVRLWHSLHIDVRYSCVSLVVDPVWISSCHCQSNSRCGSTRRKPSGSTAFFRIIMKCIVNNSTEAWKTDVNLFVFFFYNKNIAQIIDSCVCPLICMKISQWARENFYSCCKNETHDYTVRYLNLWRKHSGTF